MQLFIGPAVMNVMIRIQIVIMNILQAAINALLAWRGFLKIVKYIMLIRN